jgi:hypothetical protein
MLKQLFTSDKAPFVLSITLSVLGWLVTTSIGNLSSVVVLGVSSEHGDGTMRVTVQNHSVNKSFTDGIVRLTCIRADCLASTTAGLVVQAREHPPYLIQGNRICSSSSRDVAALVTLPPRARITYMVRPLPGTDPPVFGFSGNVRCDDTRCPDSGSKLAPDNVLIIEGASLTLFLLDYYNHILVLSMIVTVLFLIWIVVRGVSGSREESDTDAVATPRS